MLRTFGQVRHILFPYFNCMIPTNAGLVAGKAYLVAIQLYQNTGRFRTVIKVLCEQTRELKRKGWK